MYDRQVLRAPVILAALLAGAAWAPPTAAAQEFPAITDRDYAIDLYQGSVLGSVRIVGMGGAAVATAEGSASISANPAAPAVRPATSTDVWDWDWHLDGLNPAGADDFDNNGIEQGDELSFEPVWTVGLIGQLKQWAAGISVTSVRTSHPLDDSTDFDAEVNFVNLVVARSFLKRRLTIGAGLRVGDFSVYRDPDGADRSPLFSMAESNLEAGALWRPRDQDLRAGISASVPIGGSNVNTEACDPMSCEGYILPESVEIPWKLSAGVAWRGAETRWNRKVRGDWREESYLLLAGDVIVTGPVSQGHGIEAFSQNQLQPSGRDVSVSVRGGAEYEWVPGRFRVRGGSYWEPSRFQNPSGSEVPGRLHLTFGFDVGVFTFRFWDSRYRIRLSLTADAADDYGNGGLSIGFWH